MGLHLQMWRGGVLMGLLLGALACAGAPASSPASPSAVATEPASVSLGSSPLSTALVRDVATGILLPPGFRAQVYAPDLDRPTSLAYGPEGALYVSEVGGRIWALKDGDDDGVAESRQLYASGFNAPLGLAFRGEALYVSHRGKVSLLRDTDGDGAADASREIITGLPSGRHQNNGLAFGPDGKLYLTSGSATNAGPEPSPLNATILQANPDGSDLTVYAKGLRNPYDLAFSPKGELFATDNGADPPAFVDAPDELNHIIAGGDYGYPKYAGDPPKGSGTLGPAATFQPYSSSDGLVFYNAEHFPVEYRSDLFVAQWGANSGDPAIGKRVVRVKLIAQGESYRGVVSDFVLGLANPLDVAISPQGHLMVADFGVGKIYRISWAGP